MILDSRRLDHTSKGLKTAPTAPQNVTDRVRRLGCRSGPHRLALAHVQDTEETGDLESLFS